MAGRIRSEDIEEVKRRASIVDIVGDYVKLRRAGPDSYKGLSPFKDERTPSFHVRPNVGLYHCFSTGQGGDVFSFLQAVENISFVEAVEKVAARIGYQLTYEEGSAKDAEDRGKRLRILAANEAAAKFFAEQLATSPAAAPGREFLAGRAFGPEAAAHFGIGFAPRSRDALSTALKAQGFTAEELLAAGLTGQAERGSTYDRFRGRLIWPIRDSSGATLGFGARKLFDDDQGPKYLNTPDTQVYHKSKVLYGLDLARRDIGKLRQVVIVEGYTDVMAAHLAGVTTAVATCGTAFGVEHIRMIRRIMGDEAGGEVIFTFDPDAAGQKAAMRAFAEESRFTAQTYVAVAPDGLDPSDLRQHRGDQAVRDLLERKKPMFEFAIKQVLGEFNLNTVEGRVAGLRAAAPVVAAIRDPALRPGYARELAGWLGMDPQEVSRAVNAAVRAGGRGGQGGRPERGASGREAPGRDAGRYAPAGGGATAAGQQAPGEQPAAAGEPEAYGMANLPNDPITRLERDAMMAVLQQPSLVDEGRIRSLGLVAMQNPVLAAVRDAIVANWVAGDDAGRVLRIAEQVPPGIGTLVQQLAVAPLPTRPGQEVAAFVDGIVAALLERDLTRRKAELLGQLQRTDPVAEPELHRALQEDLLRLEQERRALRRE